LGHRVGGWIKAPQPGAALDPDRVGVENFEIYSMRADGSRQVNRTQHPGVDIQPDWQASG
jgi:hypothetical protein